MRNREKLLYLSSLGLILLLYIFLFLIPHFNRVESLRLKIEKKSQELQELRDIARRIKVYEIPSGRDKESLLTLIEDLARENRILSGVEYIKPIPGENREGVEVKIQGISLAQLTALLYGLEKKLNFYIRELILEKNKDSRSLNLLLRVER